MTTLSNVEPSQGELIVFNKANNTPSEGKTILTNIITFFSTFVQLSVREDHTSLPNSFVNCIANILYLKLIYYWLSITIEQLHCKNKTAYLIPYSLFHM